MKGISLPVLFFLFLGYIGLTSQILLIFGLFYRPYVIFFTIIFFAYFFYINRHTLNDRAIIGKIKSSWTTLRRDWRNGEKIIFLFIVVTVFIYTWLNFIPIMNGDAINYHIPFVADFITTHKLNYPIAGITQLGWGYMPSLAEIIYAAVILLFGIETIKIPLAILQTLILISFLSIIYKNSEAFISKRSIRLIILLCFLIMPDIALMILRVGMIDLLVYSLAISGMLFMIEWLKNKRNSNIYYAGIFWGLSAAMKLNAVIVPTYAILVIIFLFFRGFDVKKYRKPLIIFLAILALIPSYWYIKSAIEFHNPIYPLFSKANLQGALVEETTYMPKTWWTTLGHPILIYFPFIFIKSASRLTLVEFAVAFAAIFGSVFYMYKNKKADWNISFILGFALFYSWIVSHLTDDIRHNLPAFISLIILFGILLDRLSERYKKFFRDKILITSALVCFVVIFPFIINIYKNRLPLLFGKIDERSFITQSIKGDYTLEQYDKVMGFMSTASY